MIRKALVSLAGLVTAALPYTAKAGVVTIPWRLDFTFRPSAATAIVAAGPGSGTIDLENFGTRHQIQTRVSANAFGLAGFDVRAGLRFPTEARDNYSVSLPFQITFSAPDRALPGQNVFVSSSIGFTGAPSFSARGELDFGTEAFIRGEANLGPLGGPFNVDKPLPNRISGGGSGLTLGGSGSYAATDRSASAVAVGPFARSTLSEGQPIANSTARFEGRQLEVEGRVDAQRGELNLLSLLRNIPGVGTAAAAVDAAFDLDLEAGVELIERSIFSTGAIYALYTEDGGTGPRRSTVLNGLGQNGFTLAVPSDATGSYAIDLYGLGLGFGLERQMLFEPELQLVLDAIWPFGEWELFEASIDDPWLLGRQQSRFQFEEFFSFSDYPRYIPPERRLLGFALDGAAPPLPLIVDPGLPSGIVDSGGMPYTTTELPGTAPAEGVAIYTPVPSPATWMLLAPGLGCLWRARRRAGQRAANLLQPGRPV